MGKPVVQIPVVIGGVKLLNQCCRCGAQVSIAEVGNSVAAVAGYGAGGCGISNSMHNVAKVVYDCGAVVRFYVKAFTIVQGCPTDMNNALKEYDLYEEEDKDATG